MKSEMTWSVSCAAPRNAEESEKPGDGYQRSSGDEPQRNRSAARNLTASLKDKNDSEIDRQRTNKERGMQEDESYEDSAGRELPPRLKPRGEVGDGTGRRDFACAGPEPLYRQIGLCWLKV